jgi:hypothetical protein
MDRDHEPMTEPNLTATSSPEDYAKTLWVLSDEELESVAQTNLWCANHLQMQETDYHARYYKCRNVQSFRKGLTTPIQLC